MEKTDEGDAGVSNGAQTTRPGREIFSETTAVAMPTARSASVGESALMLSREASVVAAAVVLLLSIAFTNENRIALRFRETAAVVKPSSIVLDSGSGTAELSFCCESAAAAAAAAVIVVVVDVDVDVDVAVIVLSSLAIALVSGTALVSFLLVLLPASPATRSSSEVTESGASSKGYSATAEYSRCTKRPAPSA